MFSFNEPKASKRYSVILISERESVTLSASAFQNNVDKSHEPQYLNIRSTNSQYTIVLLISFRSRKTIVF